MKYYVIDLKYNEEFLGKMIIEAINLKDILKLLSKDQDVPLKCNQVDIYECSKEDYLEAKRNYESRN